MEVIDHNESKEQKESEWVTHSSVNTPAMTSIVGNRGALVKFRLATGFLKDRPVVPR